MRIEVAFTPALLTDPEGKVCLVIDVLRATSSLVTMFGRGLAEAIVVESIEEARRESAKRPGWLLCGEAGGLAPEGFDHGNSPSEFNQLDLSGRRAIVATTNGTMALARASACPVVLVAALLNLRAAARAALREAAIGGRDIAVLCAGNSRARHFSLEDAFCAGAVVDELVSPGGPTRLWSSATAARRLYRSYRGSALAAFREADHGAVLIALGFQRDLEFSAQRDRVRVVPRLERASDGSLHVLAGAAT